ncbi:hypothetical protein B4Q13_23655, partial [Lacticaseibacillus rhamnosus]
MLVAGQHDRPDPKAGDHRQHPLGAVADQGHNDVTAFYAVHKERPFYADLVRYMTSGPVVVQVLAGEGAIAKNRDIMGATDPKKALKGTIRADLAESIERNVVHGSDAAETAAHEIAFFFRSTEL